MGDIDNTLAERGKRYGDFSEHAEISQSIRRAMIDGPQWDSLTDDKVEALNMIAHKIGRILNGDPEYDDSWRDIAGYARLAEQNCSNKAGGYPACLQFVFDQEGYESDDPNDSGGHTKFGISQSAHPGLDIGNLTRDQAGTIYRDDYWRPVKGSELPDALALMVFDSAVQHGPHEARQLLQGGLGVVTDGIIGPNTLAAIRRADTRDTLKRTAARRMYYYGNLDNFAHFGRGWANRMFDCYSLAASWI